MSSDGKRKLSKTGRSPGMVFGSVEKFEAALSEIANDCEVEDSKPLTALPELPDLRIALDVATCDLRPLVIVYGENEKESEKLTTLVAAVSWSEGLVGRMRYVVIDEDDDLEAYEDFQLERGVSVVQAEDYGRGGVVLAHTADDEDLRATLAEGLASFEAKTKDVRRHIRDGERQGIEWEPAIPVTDSRASSDR